MPYNIVHPDEVTAINNKKKRVAEDKLCITCRMYFCICLTVSFLLYAIIGVTIYLVEDFGYKKYDDFLEILNRQKKMMSQKYLS